MRDVPASRGRRQKKGWIEEQNRFWYRFVELVIRLVFTFWTGCFRVFGSENVPAKGGAFLVANHTSSLDPLILGVAVPHRMLRGPGKTELFVNPLFSFMMRKLGIFPLRVGVPDAAGVRAMVTLYRQGKVVIVYPETSRSKTGEQQAFTPDFSRLAIRLRARVIPAGISGARDAMPVGRWLPRRSPIVVQFGAPFDLSEVAGQELTPELLDRTTRDLENRVRALVAEAGRKREELYRA